MENAKQKLEEYAEPPCLERIRAVMLGHAVGDALGVPVEFCSRRELDEDPVVDMRGFGTYAVPAGSWSDDTSMSLAALDSLGKGKIDWDDIMRRFGAWLESGAYTPTGETFDAGRTCTRAILNYFKNQLSPTACGGTGEHSNGNGSLMRIHPFVLYAAVRELPFEETMQTVDLASSLTHAHERSRIACGIYTILLLHLWELPDKAAIRGALHRPQLITQAEKRRRTISASSPPILKSCQGTRSKAQATSSTRWRRRSGAFSPPTPIATVF